MGFKLKEYSDISPELIQRYNRSGPRYTSYPTVPVWDQGENYSEDYIRFLQREGPSKEPLSLYIHIPFCSRLCTYCGCNQFITKRQDLVEQYLNTLDIELAEVAQQMGQRKAIQQLHLGGGTPTHLNVDQLKRLMRMIQSRFDLATDGEMALEAHPRVTTNEQLQVLYDLGFRRVSFGVQDVDAKVQHAINRDQTLAQTQRTFYFARELGYQSINIDLVYGLPFQTQKTFQKTMEEVQRMHPDRLAIYNFAYIPNMFKTHKRAIRESDLPTPEEKVVIYIDMIKFFTTAGYEMIGMDHYAESHDELAIASKNHTLHRNFMGYTTLKGLTQIGIGVSSISDFGDGYFQNQKDLIEYMDAFKKGSFSIIRRKCLSPDDSLRREIIETLMCHYHLPLPHFEKKYQIEFKAYFKEEWKQMEYFEEEGLVQLEAEALHLTKLGVLFMRNVAMPFDQYLKDESRTFNFSKTV
ncbi:oxygen-independent coproporphyrinogen III oxidase [Deltaproteobacteria bacterium TL4]